MPTTPVNHLPYPVLTDTPDVPRDIKALADTLDGLLAAPPAGGGGINLSQLPILDVGMVGQRRAGHELTPTDFTSRGLSAPLGLWNLSNVNDSSGNNRHLTNKTSVPFDTGINGLVTTAARFSGATNQALYITDTGASDPFRIRTGSWGCWLRTAKRGTAAYLLSKHSSAAGQFAWAIQIAGNVVTAEASSNGTAVTSQAGISDVADDRWHFAVVTLDGTALRVYVDGVLEGAGNFGSLLFAGSGPLNVGAFGADAATAAGAPHYGRVDEAFITADVLSEDQVRGLYCAKIPHGYTLPPSSVSLNVRRRRRGGPLTPGDFPSQPIRLHNFTAGSLGDEGSGGIALTRDNGGGTEVAGADGSRISAFSFIGTQSLSSTDAGLPAALTPRSYGCWFKTTIAAGGVKGLLAWGTLPSAYAILYTNNGTLNLDSGADSIIGPFVADGQWHFAVGVEDNAAGDGVRRKLYLDGRLVGGSTVLNAITLAGANRFRIAANTDGTAPMTGQIDGVFVHNIAFTATDIAALYAKGSQALQPSPKNAGDHVEAIDNSNLYVVFDTLDSTTQIDLAVSA